MSFVPRMLLMTKFESGRIGFVGSVGHGGNVRVPLCTRVAACAICLVLMGPIANGGVPTPPMPGRESKEAKEALESLLRRRKEAPSPSDRMWAAIREGKLDEALRIAEDWRRENPKGAESDNNFAQAYPALLCTRDPEKGLKYMKHRMKQEPMFFLSTTLYPELVAMMGRFSGAQREEVNAYFALRLKGPFLSTAEREKRWSKLIRDSRSPEIQAECLKRRLRASAMIDIARITKAAKVSLAKLTEVWESITQKVLSEREKQEHATLQKTFLIYLREIHMAALENLAAVAHRENRPMSDKEAEFRDRLIKELFLLISFGKTRADKYRAVGESVNLNRKVADVVFKDQAHLGRWCEIMFCTAYGSDDTRKIEDRSRDLSHALRLCRTPDDRRVAFRAASSYLGLNDYSVIDRNTVADYIARLSDAGDQIPAKLLCEKVIRQYPGTELESVCRRMLKRIQSTVEQSLEKKPAP